MEQQVTARPVGDDEPRTGRIVTGAAVPAPRRSPHVPPVPVARRAPATASWPAPHPSFPPVPAPPPTAWPAPAPSAAGSPGLRALVVVAVTVVALAALALAGVLLYPRLTAAAPSPAVSVPAPTTVVVPSPASSGSATGSGATGAYSCGSANGYAITVNNGNVPCTSARWVTTMWTTDGTTPMSGTGPAGTPYSWTCSSVGSSSDTVGSCVSKMGSTFTITR